MQTSKDRYFRTIFLLKFGIATLVFYVGFSYNIDQIGYESSSVGLIDYIDDIPTQPGSVVIDDPSILELQATLKDILSPTHQASDIVPQTLYTQRIQSICQAHQSLCNKIIFVGSFDPYDQYIYMATIIYVVHQVDTFLGKGGQVSLVQTLRNITINSNGGDRRGGATWDTIIINTTKIVNHTEFFEVFTHELGHVVDLGVMKGASRTQDQQFTEFGRVVFAADDPSIEYYTQSWRSESTRTLGSTQEDFCSGYGMTNPFEDFAECFNMYLNHNAYFRSIAANNTILKEKYNFLANIMGGHFLAISNIDIEKAKNKRSNRRPRDTTRMR